MQNWRTWEISRWRPICLHPVLAGWSSESKIDSVKPFKASMPRAPFSWANCFRRNWDLPFPCTWGIRNRCPLPSSIPCHRTLKWPNRRVLARNGGTMRKRLTSSNRSTSVASRLILNLEGRTEGHRATETESVKELRQAVAEAWAKKEETRTRAEKGEQGVAPHAAVRHAAASQGVGAKSDCSRCWIPGISPETSRTSNRSIETSIQSSGRTGSTGEG